MLSRIVFQDSAYVKSDPYTKLNLNIPKIILADIAQADGRAGKYT